jgi:hypothetical protein
VVVEHTVDLTLSEDWKDLGYRIELGRAMSFSKGSLWSARISRRRETKGGNEGKPDHILTLVHDDDPIALLHQVAELFQAGMSGPVPLSEPET